MSRDAVMPAVTIELEPTTAMLLASLSVELDMADDPAGVVSRALGLLEMVQRTRRHGGRLCFVNERGETADVVF